jgi:hypothetical protein
VIIPAPGRSVIGARCQVPGAMCQVQGLLPRNRRTISLARDLQRVLK